MTGCGQGRHDAIKEDEALWKLATFVGFQATDPGRLELRQCPHCGSTLAKPDLYFCDEYPAIKLPGDDE